MRGGAERYLELLLHHLPSELIGEIVCLKRGPFAADLENAGHSVEVIDTGRSVADIVRSARRLRRSLARSRPAVVHANGLKAAVVAEAATVGTSTPVIWFKHDFSGDGWLSNIVARRAAEVIGPSSAVVASLGKAGRVRVIHPQLPDPVVDEASARRLVESEFAPGGAEAVVALVGRLDAFKGHSDVIAAAPSILERAPRTRFLFVGGEDPAHPDQLAQLEAEIEALGLAEAFRFTGHRSDAIELISGSDALVIPTISKGRYGKEAFPYVGLEALAVGTPIVCYAHGGLPEQVGECGVLVPPGDRDALGNELLALVEDRDRRQALAACGRARFEREFRWGSLVDNVVARYVEVAARGSRTSSS